MRPGLRHLPVRAYVGAIVLITVILVGVTAAWLPLPVAFSARCGVVVLLALVASQLSVTLVNWLAAHLASPQALPRMDYSLGLPPEASTLVVVPTLLADAESAQDDVDDLEIRYLANRQANLYFALLTDFPDAASENCPDDASVLATAVAGIERLNRLYADAGDAVFYLLHRPRRWNASEAVWMGEERKRGKLGDLNALLRGHGAERFSCIVGPAERLRVVRYVITLDADTRLPHDAAQELVATLHHPLNHAQFDARSGRVVAGYGILQPRVGTTLPPAGASAYAALFGGDLGLDPYTRAVSDAYQDLFGEGSFTGKGIYDVDAFERSLAGRMPDNRILSHDLLEGCYARSGLASDLAVFESFPQSYAADMKRRQRWIRGDWQLTPWLWPRVPLADGGHQRNPLPALARWKIFDNLRRSLVAPALLALLILVWIGLAAPVRWTACLLSLTLLPVALETLLATARKSADASWGQHLRLASHNGMRRFGQVAFMLLCLPYEAVISLDAIARTLWRRHVSRRRLLEWVSFSAIQRRGDDGCGSFLRRMAIAPAMAVVAGVAIALYQPAALEIALPFLALWLAAPFAAWFASRAPRPVEASLDTRHVPALREVARRTWRYFEHFAGPDNHWLAPDNFQEQPGGQVAHRTSPTNIGLGLLAILAACDFGYLTRRRLIERLEAAFDSLDRLERYRGHLYNWYDTRTLTPLQPRYVSTVDSGNFAGHLLTLRQGLLALAATAQRQQMAGEVAAVDGGHIARLQRCQRACVVPVVQMAAVALQAVQRIECGLQAFDHTPAREIAEIVRGQRREQADTSSIPLRVFEHRAAPGQQHRCAAGLHQQAAQREPAADRDASLRDGDEHAQPRFRGEQVVVAAVAPVIGDIEADAEQVAGAVVQEFVVEHGELRGARGEALQVIGLIRRWRRSEFRFGIGALQGETARPAHALQTGRLIDQRLRLELQCAQCAARSGVFDRSGRGGYEWCQRGLVRRRQQAV
ncbi:MAG TPA: glycosyltransferase family 2 protein, partial [Tahibacter sp.]|nr:glycosyltransferase family 2 protein [Tahibacter sp.]